MMEIQYSNSDRWVVFESAVGGLFILVVFVIAVYFGKRPRKRGKNQHNNYLFSLVLIDVLSFYMSMPVHYIACTCERLQSYYMTQI